MEDGSWILINPGTRKKIFCLQISLRNNGLKEVKWVLLRDLLKAFMLMHKNLKEEGRVGHTTQSSLGSDPTFPKLPSNGSRTVCPRTPV